MYGYDCRNRYGYVFSFRRNTSKEVHMWCLQGQAMFQSHTSHPFKKFHHNSSTFLSYAAVKTAQMWAQEHEHNLVSGGNKRGLPRYMGTSHTVQSVRIAAAAARQDDIAAPLTVASSLVIALRVAHPHPAAALSAAGDSDPIQPHPSNLSRSPTHPPVSR